MHAAHSHPYTNTHTHTPTPTPTHSHTSYTHTHTHTWTMQGARSAPRRNARCATRPPGITVIARIASAVAADSAPAASNARAEAALLPTRTATSLQRYRYEVRLSRSIIQSFSAHKHAFLRRMLCAVVSPPALFFSFACASLSLRARFTTEARVYEFLLSSPLRGSVSRSAGFCLFSVARAAFLLALRLSHSR